MIYGFIDKAKYIKNNIPTKLSTCICSLKYIIFILLIIIFNLLRRYYNF